MDKQAVELSEITQSQKKKKKVFSSLIIETEKRANKPQNMLIYNYVMLHWYKSKYNSSLQ